MTRLVLLRDHKQDLVWFEIVICCAIELDESPICDSLAENGLTGSRHHLTQKMWYGFEDSCVSRIRKRVLAC